ncbi:MAG: zinc ribbon domain-containing protein, partial [Eubacterium sp.]|nr:zinc ribbon domain-containing protein [Eubacterium sp.]
MFCGKCGKKNVDSAMFCERCGNRLVKISPEENSGSAGLSGGYIPGRDGRPFQNHETQEPADRYPGYETPESADQYPGYETQESEDSYYEYDPYQEYNQQTDEGGYSVSEAAARNQRISGSAGGQGFPGAGRQDFSGTGTQDFPGAERERQGFSGAGGQRRSEVPARGQRVSEAAARLNRTYSEVSSGGRPAAPAISKGLIAV